MLCWSFAISPVFRMRRSIALRRSSVKISERGRLPEVHFQRHLQPDAERRVTLPHGFFVVAEPVRGLCSTLTRYRPKEPGGETLFASAQLAYERLPVGLRERIDGSTSCTAPAT